MTDACQLCIHRNFWDQTLMDAKTKGFLQTRMGRRRHCFDQRLDFPAILA